MPECECRSQDVRSVYLSEGDVPLKNLVNCQPIEIDFDSLHLNVDTPDDLELLKTASTESWF